MEHTTAKPAGIKEIANALGISIGTVDRALHNRQGVSPQTRARVLKIAERLQYQPNVAAHNLKLNRRVRLAIHLLANESNIWFWIGASYATEDRPEEARKAWQQAAQHRRDFRQMSVRAISDMTSRNALAMQCLGKREQAQELFQAVFDRSVQLEQEKPKVDYFATSLPAMLLFEADLGLQNKIDTLFLRAKACLRLGRCADAESLLRQVLDSDKNHIAAAELQQERAFLSRLAGLKPSC